MASNKGTVIFQGDIGSPHTGQRGKTSLDGCADLATVVALGTALAAYSTANIGSSGYHTSNNLIPARPATNANVDRKGVVVMQEDSTGKIIKITIPAFSKGGADVEFKEGGERITKAARDAIASACSTASGRTLTAIDGYVVQPK